MSCKSVIPMLQGLIAIETHLKHKTNAISDVEFCEDSIGRSGEGDPLPRHEADSCSWSIAESRSNWSQMVLTLLKRKGRRIGQLSPLAEGLCLRKPTTSRPQARISPSPAAR